MDRDEATAEFGDQQSESERIIVMGDYYNNISGVVVNRSRLKDSLKSVQSSYGDNVADALAEIALIVDKSGDAAAGAIFGDLSRELSEPTPDKDRLNSLWKGLTAVLPAILVAAKSVEALVRVFA